MGKEESECPLCRLARGLDRITKQYYEDNVVVCCDCKTHHVPMIVLKRHVRFPSPEERKHMNRIAKSKFPMKQFRPPASIKDHWHLHSM
jgi:hypothetical protein